MVLQQKTKKSIWTHDIRLESNFVFVFETAVSSFFTWIRCCAQDDLQYQDIYHNTRARNSWKIWKRM